MRIVFVGSNPSQKRKLNGAFTPDTVSGRVLHEWIRAAEIDLWHTLNIVDYITENNRPLNKSEILPHIPHIKLSLSFCTKIVAMGKTAHKALQLAGIPHLEMPHPSGLNRKLNDPEYVSKCIAMLRDYAR
jgi:uracil-DNA glycosylase